MISRIKTNFFSPVLPAHADPEKNLRTWFLSYILRSLIVILSLLFVAWLLSDSDPFSRFNLITDAILLGLIGIMFFLMKLTGRGRATLASIVLIASFWLSMAYIAWIADGVRDLALLGHFIVILIGGLVLGWQSSLALALLSVGYIFALVALQLNGVLHPTLQPPLEFARDLSSILVLTSVITTLILKSITKVMDQLRVSERQFRSAFENAPIGVAIVGLDRKILQANQAFGDILGYSPEQLTSLTVADVTHPEDWETEKALQDKLLDAEKHTFSMIKRYIHADGHVVWGKLHLSLVFDKSQRPVYFLGQVEDITEHKQTEDELRRTHDLLLADISERKRAEEALRESRNLLQTILDTIPTRIFWKDRDLQYLGCNLPFSLDAGIDKPAEMIGKNDYQMSWKEQAELYRGDDCQVMETGQPKLNYEEPQTTPDGSRIWLRTSKAPLRNLNGDIIGVLGTYEDITERKRAEEEIRRMNEELDERVRERTRQLEAANQELEAFAYSVSHDLRAPLRAISGYTSLLIADYGSLLDSEAQLLCNNIQSGARRMDQLIDDLLMFSRLGRSEMYVSEIDMGALVAATYQELTAAVDRERIDFCVAPLPRIKGDLSLIKQVWINLLSNAIKFSSKRSRGVIRVSGEEANGETVFCVKDNGTGFDMRYVDKLFGVFQRLHSGHDFPGTGVGLAIVQRVVQRHNGRVWAEGQSDQGAAFYFALPAASAGP